MLEAYSKGDELICGCDEAGRGPLAGPVVAGAVILPSGFRHPLLNDSKIVTEKSRDILREVIEKEALFFGVGVLDHKIIDEINILNASFKAMHVAIEQMKAVPELIIVDGNRFTPYKDIAFKCFVKGDGRFTEIAAASILAKTYRDEIMQELHGKFPMYGWNKNKGYPTKQHREAIKEHGPSPYHRMSFRLLKEEEDV